MMASLFADNYIIVLYGDRKWIPTSKGKLILYYVVRIAFYFAASKVFDYQHIFETFLSIL